MKTTFQTGFSKASHWVKRYARPLEAARWQYAFERASSAPVIHYLSAFQNEDGGFGHGLEPDFWLPQSSPMATWAGGQILMEVGASPKEPLVQSMITYLVRTKTNQGMWPSVLPENNEHPHAPWWHWQEGIQQNWMFNPSAELAAFLVYWSPAQSEANQLGWLVIKKAVERLMVAESMDVHEVNNFQQMCSIVKGDKDRFQVEAGEPLEAVQNKVLSLAEDCIEKDPATWSTGYVTLPLNLIDSPDHPLYIKMKDLVTENISFYLEHLTEDGIWEPSWNWGTYPEQFPIAKQYWQGILALMRYKLLHNFKILS